MSGVSINTNYSGEVLNEILTKISIGNEMVDGGHVRIESNISHKFYLPRMKASGILQDDAVKPVSGGTATFDERVLQPLPFMAYLEWLPDQFKSYWTGFQPQGNLIFQELPNEIQVAILDEIAKEIAKDMGSLILQGDTALGGANSLRHFNGLITKAEADADVIDVSTPVSLNVGNIEAEMLRTYRDVPVHVKRNPNFKIFVSDATAELYLDSQIALTQKGPSYLDPMVDLRFKGKPIVGLVGMPDDCIFMTHSSAGRDSNLWFGIDWDQSDFESAILVDRVANNSRMHFAMMRMKADTQIKWGEECVLYKV